VTAARETVAAIATQRIPRVYRQCVYCGHPCRGLSCPAHRDLLLVDPNFYTLRLRTGGAERKQA
jgi:hypothetical protein